MLGYLSLTGIQKLHTMLRWASASRVNQALAERPAG